jgi:hypothetical protein
MQVKIPALCCISFSRFGIYFLFAGVHSQLGWDCGQRLLQPVERRANHRLHHHRAHPHTRLRRHGLGHQGMRGLLSSGLADPPFGLCLYLEMGLGLRIRIRSLLKGTVTRDGSGLWGYGSARIRSLLEVTVSQYGSGVADLHSGIVLRDSITRRVWGCGSSFGLCLKGQYHETGLVLRIRIRSLLKGTVSRDGPGVADPHSGFA